MMKICNAEGCNNKSYVKGYCQKHYMRLYKTGILYIKDRTIPIIDRILKKIKIDKNSNCWEFQGTTDIGGYGKIGGKIEENYKILKVHRITYEYYNGPIPDGLLVCHKCDNPKCCNPEHLFIGTHKDNTQDAVKKGRMKRKNNIDKIPRKIVEQILNDKRHYSIIAKQYKLTYGCVASIKNGYSDVWISEIKK